MANPRIEVEIGAVIDGLRKGFGESVKIIETLEKQALDLDKALKAATDLPEIQSLNQRLAQTKAALSQLKSAGVDPLTKATSQYNSVGIEFSRIIQDAPFGIIGVGNNITQLAGSFQQLRSTSTSTGAALKTAFASIISPTNLLVLGVSAVTTALTLYSQSAIGAKGPINDLKQAQDDYNDSLKETDKLLGAEVFGQFLKEVGLVERQNIGGRLIDVPTFESAIEVVDKLSGKISTLRKGELELLSNFFQTQISESLRTAANNSDEWVKKLSQEDINLYQGLLNKVNVQLGFYKLNTEKSTKSTSNLNTEVEKLNRNFTDLAALPSLGLPREGDIDALRKRFQQIQEGGNVGQTGNEFIQNAIEQIKSQGIITSLPISQIAIDFDQVADQVKLRVEDLSEAFNGLGSLIGRAFKNPQFGNFLGQFAQFVTKVVAGAFAVAKANAVAGATQSSLFTGPAAVFTLPAFIAGAVGLVASAFASIKGSSGVGGGSVASSSATSFIGGGAQGGLFQQNRDVSGEFVVRGSDLVYVLGQAGNRINKG
jgi:hypothetical protein